MSHGTYIFVTTLHVLAAMVWIGGAAFLGMVLIPVVKRPEYRAQAAELIQVSGRKFKHIGWSCLLILIVTGVANMHYRGMLAGTEASTAMWRGTFGQLLGMKIVLVTVVLLLSLYHDLFVGPKAVRLWKDDPESEAAQRVRKLAGWIGRVTVLLGIAITALAVMMVRGRPW